MINTIDKYGNWHLYALEAQNVELPGIDAILSSIQSFDTVLKDNRRSFVARGQLAGMDVVAKQPHNKDRRLWPRVLTLFRTSEVKKTMATLARFKDLGVESLTPLCALEHRRLGVVTASWLIYFWRDGQTCSPQELPQIVRFLKHMHRLGFQHGDPNLGNFLIDNDQILFTIDSKGQARKGSFSDWYDILMLSQRKNGVSHEQVMRCVDNDNETLGFKLAKFYIGFKQARRFLKDIVRGTET